LAAAAEGDETERRRQALEFVDFYAKQLVAHFREEEELLFPLIVEETDARALLARLLLEHLRVHCLVRVLISQLGRGTASEDPMKKLSTTLEAHIRAEEKELFPLVQRMTPGAVLNELVLAPRDRGPATSVAAG
jgi:hemerythrin-like domain-containing protein